MTSQNLKKPSRLRAPSASLGTPRLLDQTQNIKDRNGPSTPLKENSTLAPHPPKSSRSLLPDIDSGRLQDDGFNISSLAISSAMRSRYNESKDKHSYHNELLPDRPSHTPIQRDRSRSALQPFKHPGNANTECATSLSARLSKSEPSNLIMPTSVDYIRESRRRSKIPLPQTKSTPPIRIPCAIIVNPGHDTYNFQPLPGAEVATELMIESSPRQTPPEGRKSAEKVDIQDIGFPSLPTPSSELAALIYALDHFSFFYVLDSKSPETPIVCASQFPWPSSQLKEKCDKSFANGLQEGRACEIMTEIGPDGDELSYLVLISSFPTVAKGERRYLLACVVDITSFLKAAVPGETGCNSQRTHGSRKAPQTGIRELKLVNSLPNPVSQSDDDKLTTVAHNGSEVRSRNAAARRERKALRLKHYLTKNAPTTSCDLLDRTVDEFTAKFLELYTDYFMLARSLSNDEYYEMTHVSGNIEMKGEFLDGHLRHCSREVMRQIKKALSRDERFTIMVQWGDQPLEKRLYCVPLIDPQSQSWICLLIEPGVPLLWHTNYRGYFG